MLGIALAEGLARLLDEVPVLDFPFSLPIRAGVAAVHLDEIPRAESVPRDLFFETPPPLPNRTKPDPKWQAAFEEIEHAHVAEGRPFRGGDLFKAWNSVRVGDPCSDRFFKGAPGRLFVFDPPDRTPYPLFRFWPNFSSPDNLVTNAFGWRGPPVPFQRAPRTVRIVFVGASTTVSSHSMPHSYPEFIGHWLDLWAKRRGLEVGFETLNAGRESVGSTDIAAIVRDEVAPLRPDLVVYYEGANQFQLDTVVHDVPAGQAVAPAKLEPSSPIAAFVMEISRYSALVRRVQAAGRPVDRPAAGREWAKPAYTLDWPAGLDEHDPDIARPDLPVHLSTIVRDLDRMRNDLAGVGAEFAVSSFVWLVRDGLELDPVRHRYILDQLNIGSWPFTYLDLERLAAFQNRVLAKYARTRGAPFIDVAARMPLEPDLFIDAIHNTYAGERMHAWVTLQQLVPLIERHLAGGDWPRPMPDMGAMPRIFTQQPREIAVSCPAGN